MTSYHKEANMKIIQYQSEVSASKQDNLNRLAKFMAQTQGEQGDLVMAGEMFTCPYDVNNFREYSEPEGGPSFEFLAALAKKYQVYLAAGTVPEIDDEGNVYNTAYVFDRQGKLVGKHRKVHLFDINIAGGQCFKESAVLSAGNQVTVFDSEFGKIGLCICFDVRFNEIFRIMTDLGAKVILIPAAFNTTTGPLHWQLLMAARAIDNQCFVIATSPARSKKASYQAWGHSLAMSPWGKIIKELDESPGYLVSEIDRDEVGAVREQLPVVDNLRDDLYEVVYKAKK